MMKNRRNNRFTEAAPRLLKEYPLVFLAVILAALWFYSLGMLCISAAPVGGAVYVSESAPAGGNEKFASLQDDFGLYRQYAAGRARILKLAEASEGSPFNVSIKIQPEIAKYLPEQAPPLLDVRAVAVGAKVRTALIDIDGEYGRLVCENESLLSGAGKVMRISSEGITWIWNSEEFFSPLKG